MVTAPLQAGRAGRSGSQGRVDREKEREPQVQRAGWLARSLSLVVPGRQERSRVLVSALVCVLLMMGNQG